MFAKEKTLLYIAYEMGWLTKLEALKTINIHKFGKLKCELCKKSLSSPSIDHIIPTSKGGTNSLDNLRLTHSKCNGVRSNKFTWKDKLKLIFL